MAVLRKTLFVGRLFQVRAFAVVAALLLIATPHGPAWSQTNDADVTKIVIGTGTVGPTSTTRCARTRLLQEGRA